MDPDATKPLGANVHTRDLPTQTLNLPLFGQTNASYHISPSSLNPSNPTVILLPNFAQTIDQFTPQLTSSTLQSKINMLAVNPLGHGSTRTSRENFTAWDTASMVLRIVDELCITGQIYVAGIGQGGWIAVCTALLASERVAGMILLDTTLTSTPPNFPLEACIENWAKPNTTRIFEPDEVFIEEIVRPYGTLADRDFWSVSVKKNWSGEEGRRRARSSAICCLEREDLCGRLGEVRCKVLWMQGKSGRWGVEGAREQVELFGGEKRLEVLDEVEGRMDGISELLVEFVVGG